MRIECELGKLSSFAGIKAFKTLNTDCKSITPSTQYAG